MRAPLPLAASASEAARPAFAVVRTVAAALGLAATFFAVSAPATRAATMLHLMGFDHERLTYRYAGRDFRLTDVAGEVVHGLLA